MSFIHHELHSFRGEPELFNFTLYTRPEARDFTVQTCSCSQSRLQRGHHADHLACSRLAEAPSFTRLSGTLRCTGIQSDPGCIVVCAVYHPLARLSPNWDRVRQAG